MASTHAQQVHPDDIEQCPKLDAYEHLDPTHREIRLIRLGDDIDIQKCALRDAPQYHAISYNWGPPEPTQTVKIQNQFVDVRQSVIEIFEALKARHGTEEWYWIDIFCINQHDLAERNGQVSIMTAIFAQAIDVLMWLGRASPETKTIFRLIDGAICCPENVPRRLASEDSIVYSGDAFAEGNWPSTADMEADSELCRRFAETVVWPAFEAILQRPYWSRMWVVQEVIVAKECIVLCGPDATSIDEIVSIGESWMRKSQIYQPSSGIKKFKPADMTKNQEAINTWVPLSKLVQYRTQYLTGEILLMELVDSYAGRCCSNILDKVYALRALSREAATIEVDYSRSAPEVFLSLVESGLLLSDHGRGFQSLPWLSWCMGIDQSNIDEILSAVKEVFVPIRGIPTGKIVQVT